VRGDLSAVCRVLREKDRFLIACHENPEGDAVGSELALALALREMGKTATVLNADPVPANLLFLPGAGTVVFAEDGSKYDVAVVVDCGSPERTGRVGPELRKCPLLVNIDHHRSNDGLGTVPLIDPATSSTCEMVFRLIETMGGGMTADTAICLYAGLVTDTGRFQYQATTPETLRIAAALREHDFDHAGLVQALYEDNPREYLRLVGTALGRLAYEADADLVWTYLTQADLREAGVHPSETDDLIDVIRTARDVDVAALVKQQKDGRFKVSMRSRGEHDLAAVAAAFGGGGHRLAAGYTSAHGPAETVARLIGALKGEPVAP